MEYFLSILIPTIPGRRAMLDTLIDSIHKQMSEYGLSNVEIHVDNREGITTGAKRNWLLTRATGKYIWFVDDDDEISSEALPLLSQAISKDPDVIGINGWMTTNGAERVDWEIRLGHPYKAVKKDGKEYYLRHPNHITPMRRTIAAQIVFPDKYQREDYEWAVALKESGLLKTQEIVDVPLYHYKFLTNK